MPAATALQSPRPRRAVPGAFAPDDFAMLDRLGTVVPLRREQPLFHEADPAEHYFKVISGAVRSCNLLADGRRHVGDFFLAGDFIGFNAASTYIFTAEAVTETVVVRYSRRHFDAIAWREPHIVRHLLELACKSLSAAHSQMVLLGRKTAEERIASFILDLVVRNGVDDRIMLPMSRTDIGDHLGLTMETVSRTFAQLRKDGVIELKSSHDVTIRDRAALEALAQAD
jgi:CRP-like cAMP-binding protein